MDSFCPYCERVPPYRPCAYHVLPQIPYLPYQHPPQMPYGNTGVPPAPTAPLPPPAPAPPPMSFPPSAPSFPYAFSPSHGYAVPEWPSRYYTQHYNPAPLGNQAQPASIQPPFTAGLPNQTHQLQGSSPALHSGNQALLPASSHPVAEAETQRVQSNSLTAFQSGVQGSQPMPQQQFLQVGGQGLHTTLMQPLADNPPTQTVNSTVTPAHAHAPVSAPVSVPAFKLPGTFPLHGKISLMEWPVNFACRMCQQRHPEDLCGLAQHLYAVECPVVDANPKIKCDKCGRKGHITEYCGRAMNYAHPQNPELPPHLVEQHQNYMLPPYPASAARQPVPMCYTSFAGSDIAPHPSNPQQYLPRSSWPEVKPSDQPIDQGMVFVYYGLDWSLRSIRARMNGAEEPGLPPVKKRKRFRWPG